MTGKIKTFGKRLGLLLANALILFAAFAAHEWYAKPFFIGNFANRAFVQYLLKSPEELTLVATFVEQLTAVGTGFA